jgi:hypothetical protein
MSQRTQSHVLESASRLAFEQSLPGTWIFRDVNPDYGIDGTVEVFDKSGKATGDFFLVQLKATWKASLTEALSLRLKTTTVRYFSSQILPVLVALFHAPTDSIFAKWYEPLPNALLKHSTVTFTLSLKDRWTKARIRETLSRLHRVRELNSRGKRADAIDKYYGRKHALDLSAKPSFPRVASNDLPSSQPGTRLRHAVFGDGIVTLSSPYYLFIRFDNDEMDRKFDPGHLEEFEQI